MDQKKIGKYIADKRKEQGLTQVNLAEKLGVGDKSVSKWERGVCLPDVSKYQDLCNTLAISLNEFFAGEDLEEDNIICQSEKNLMGVSRWNKNKRKRLLTIIAMLVVCILFLATAFLWKLEPVRGNYITAYSIDNPEVASMLFLYGNACLYQYSLDDNFEKVTVEILKYNNGKATDKTVEKLDLPYGRQQKEMIGIIPDLDEGGFHIALSTNEGEGLISEFLSVHVTEEESRMGWSPQDMEAPVHVEKGKKITLYALQAGEKQHEVYPLTDINKNPEEILKNTDLCYLVSVTFH